MAEELPYRCFGEVAPLCRQAVFGRARAEAALTLPKSRVFVDDACRPQLALVCLRGDDIWLLTGKADRAAVHDLIEHVAAQPGLCVKPLIVRPATPELDDLTIAEFGDRLTVTRVLAYELDPAYVPYIRAWRQRLPEDCEVRRVDAELMVQIGRNVDVDFHDLWPDPEEFETRGVAFCLMSSGQPASLAWTYGPPTTSLEIAIGTAADARGRGYGTIVASVLIEYALNKRLHPVWMTWEANKASRAVAKKVGFYVPIWHHWLTVAPCPSMVR